MWSHLVVMTPNTHIGYLVMYRNGVHTCGVKRELGPLGRGPNLDHGVQDPVTPYEGWSHGYMGVTTVYDPYMRVIRDGTPHPTPHVVTIPMVVMTLYASMYGRYDGPIIRRLLNH